MQSIIDATEIFEAIFKFVRYDLFIVENSPWMSI